MVFDLELLVDRPGLLTFRIDGPRALQTFAHEAGGHRWQRVPPTEKRGRVHTSTVTVAVLPVPESSTMRLDPKDLKWTMCRGSGAGGQHRNVTDSAVQLVHIPTGTTVRCEKERSQHRNKAMALDLLRAKLHAADRGAKASKRASKRKNQVGTGMRGDKRRTVRVQDGVVTDHILGHKWRYKDYIRGNFSTMS